MTPLSPLTHHVPVTQNRWDLVPPPATAPTVSVVVPYYEQADDLDRLLAAVGVQRGPADIREVVVVDDGSPRPPEVPDAVGGIPVVLLRQADEGIRPAAARNLGVTRATGDVLVFLDGDTVPGPDAVARLAALPAVTPDAMVVGRRFHVDLEGWSPQQTAAWLTGDRPTAPRAFEDPAWLRDGYRARRDLIDLDDRSYQWVIGAIMGTSRRFFGELGGFDGSIVCYGGEDWEIAYRAHAAGGVLAHVAGAEGFHNGPSWAELHDHAGVKNPERLAWQRTIPGRDDPLCGPFALTTVTLAAAGWSLDHTVATVGDVLRAGGTSVRVGVVGGPAGIETVVAHDGRVGTGPVDGAVEARSLTRIEVRAPVAVGPEGLDVVAALVAPGGPGVVEVADDHGPLLAVRSSRALARSRRWAGRFGGEEAALDELFGRGRADAAGLPVERLGEVVDLSLRLPR